MRDHLIGFVMVDRPALTAVHIIIHAYDSGEVQICAITHTLSQELSFTCLRVAFVSCDIYSYGFSARANCEQLRLRVIYILLK